MAEIYALLVSGTDDNSPAVGHLVAPFETWSRYSQSAEDLVHLTHEGFSRVRMMPDLYEAIQTDKKPLIDSARWKVDRARIEMEAGFPNLHAHSLLGLWGAFECLVEDVFIAQLKNDPSNFERDVFKKVKLPLSSAYSEDEAERYGAILIGASRELGADVSLGTAKFERLLEAVGLGGPVPTAIGRAIFTAQQVRNVWAHRGGFADARFSARCPYLEIEVGTRVDMDADMFMPLMHAFHMYGVLIVNRFADSVGNAKVAAECQGYEGSLAEVWPDLAISIRSPATDTPDLN